MMKTSLSFSLGLLVVLMVIACDAMPAPQGMPGNPQAQLGSGAMAACQGAESGTKAASSIPIPGLNTGVSALSGSVTGGCKQGATALGGGAAAGGAAPAAPGR